MAKFELAAAATIPLVAGLGGAPYIAVQEPPFRTSTVTVRAASKAFEIPLGTINVSLAAHPVIPLSVSTFIPQQKSEEDEVDYFDVDFGDPDPFVVPTSWIEQFTNVRPEGGLHGPLFEED